MSLNALEVTLNTIVFQMHTCIKTIIIWIISLESSSDYFFLHFLHGSFCFQHAQLNLLLCLLQFPLAFYLFAIYILKV